MPPVIEIDCGLNYCMAYSENNKLYTWGDNQWGQLGDGTFESRSKPVEIRIPDQPAD
ncbi:hypothetical protein [Marinicrinis sediminis]|uniref:Uncharacterized protein n=1 Tax=Marinicrinis sediminis TaxID=1652465 RepID=A0ABW5R5M4_9BACL